MRRKYIFPPAVSSIYTRNSSPWVRATKR